MTPEERQVITAIFERLRAAENQPRDPEAERLIADLIARQPYAPYVMAQSIYVGEQALANLNRRLEELTHELEEAKAQAQARPQSGGFLSSLFGGGQRPEPEPPRDPYAQHGPNPWGNQAQRGYAPQPQSYPQGAPGYGQGPMPGYGPQPGPWGGPPQGGGGGFLQSAISTAAGVAGGVVLGNVLSNAFSHRGGSGFGTSAAGSEPGGGSGFSGPFDGSGFRQDDSTRDAGSAHFGRDDQLDRDDDGARGLTDASFGQSQNLSHEDTPMDHGDGDDDTGFTHDSDFSDDDPGGFSGDV